MDRTGLAARTFIKVLAVAAGLALFSTDADAISRYNSTSMSCAAIKAKVRAAGAVILRWSSPQNTGNTLFGRFVANNNYCSSGELLVRASVPSADRKSCTVYECKRHSWMEDDLLFEPFRR